MKSFAGVVRASLVAIACLFLLSSCSRLLPTFFSLDEAASILFATCFDYEDVTSVTLRLTNPVDGDPRAFEENTITFTGPALDVLEGRSISVPVVAEGWSADADYSEFADWTHATISFATDDGGGFSSGPAARSDLRTGHWTQLGQNFDGCDAPM